MDASERRNRELLRSRDAIDRNYRDLLDIAALAGIAHVTRAEYIRRFAATFGETPHRYLQRRRIERAMALLVFTDSAVTDICMEVGLTSLGTFSRTFRAIVGCSPTEYRRTTERPAAFVPTGFRMRWSRIV